jgi:hypothetical protein
MLAQLPTSPVSNARNLDKELVAYYKLVAFRDGEFHEPIDCRCWMGRGSSSTTVYASVWVHGRDIYTSGYGIARGYGYCKKSAALAGAFKSAGIVLDEDIDGRGESAIRAAVLAVGAALGFEHMHVVEG